LAVLAGSGCEESPPPYNPSASLVGEISGDFALAHVGSLVSFGPRPAGSEALETSRVYLEDQLGELGWETRRQTFSAKTPEANLEFVNLRARFGKNRWDEPVRGLLSAHYDTKRFEGFAFVGANDGGSGTAAVLELARVLRLHPELARKIELVFFDGEEAFGPTITPNDGLYGSRHYAKELLMVPAKQRPRWGILLDMVGDRDLHIRAAVQIPSASLRDLAETREKSGYIIDIVSVQADLQQMARDLRSAASDLDVSSQVGVSPNYIVDDHIPLNVIAGVPTIDLIDFDYPYWHTPADTLDKVSAESLAVTARVTLQLLEKYSRHW
jgi:glutaminyl-peptide cyclotransferase